MIEVSVFHLSNDQQELLPALPAGYPYLCGYAELDQYVDRCFSWHWHSVFELGYVDAGEIELRAGGLSVTLQPGDAYFVNANVMHDLRAKDGQSGCVLYSHKFELNFLTGSYDNVLADKYLEPMLHNPKLQTYVLRPNSKRRIRIVNRIVELIEMNREDRFGQEFEVRSELCRIWCLLLEETAHLHGFREETDTPDHQRIKQMIAYIQENYGEHLSLAQIGASANVSARECSRCFRQTIGQSPMQYLNRHRIRAAAQMLQTTAESVMTVSEACGFSSVSYFGKVFQQATGLTPREYRRQTRGE